MRILFLSLLVFVAWGCKDMLTQHNIELGGVEHGKKLYSGVKNCTACHGVHLDGNGPVPGCRSCHAELWNQDDHEVNRGGTLHHGKLGQAQQVCVDCHASDLRGSYSRPSCYQCHEDVWTAFEGHSVIKGGTALHQPGLESPSANCASCHGLDLTGSGSAPSCYSCHNDLWTFASTHTQAEEGVRHMPGLESPQGVCTTCHGADLKGSGSVPSCYACHDDEWNE